MKKVLDILDYLFYRFYRFFSSHRIFRGMEEVDATGMVFLIIFLPIYCLIGLILHHYSIPSPARYSQGHLLRLLFIYIVTYYPLQKRYTKPSLEKNNYKIFKDRWGNENPKQHKQRGWIIVFITINNLVLFQIALAVVDNLLFS